ncbi:hypothetical protein DFP72DRAFT_986482 [Ephemerocybe angulata]|uniref:CxC1-like cysteine cluster associated with KDZ transposases domain-containing protein n=1 Tax=Ephemerocybe angulata TaxID=980116 RepID=A0A8H6MGE2_9AGAR|nr:hypothetical protein DFP72DRAFT_986482 [Tulosesus angulatus]
MRMLCPANLLLPHRDTTPSKCWTCFVRWFCLLHWEIRTDGLIPSSPYDPVYSITVRTLEVFRNTHLRSPHLSLEAFVKTLCDLYGVCYRPSLRAAFSNCYDVYIRLRNETENRIKLSLNRTGLWRRRNACPACTYRVAGEEKLTFGMLVAMDGNDSLKRILRRLLDSSYAGVEDDDSSESIQPSAEREDPRAVGEDIYIKREAVNRWNWETRFEGGPARSEEDIRIEGGDDNPCASRWNNMLKAETAKTWGIFDETGVFLCLCRHGFVLALADMVKSGELSKYPIAVVESLLDAFGMEISIGCGYDIGCKFQSTLNASALGVRAKTASFKCLVGSFHGHAHNRTCQLSNLAMYIEGLGLEDLEGCERFFSKSNALARSCRYASPFHRKQGIEEYCKHVDTFETAQNLSKFIVDNYKQALALIAGEPELRRQMESAGISGTRMFHEWLEEERKYLNGLTKEPAEETVKMDYYEALIKFEKEDAKFKAMGSEFLSVDPANPQAQSSARSNKRRVAKERAERAMQAVHTLELHLGIEKRWTSESDEWKAAEDLVDHREYRRRLDELERLVVSRMFELTKMNMSQTGYKLRKHISQALQTRSQAIRTALDHYNKAAQALKPRRPKLTWDEVVEYAFLADFDLLRNSREDIRARPWAQPVNRALRDRYFKIRRAREEIKRLNIEIKRVVTHIQDEENFLLAAEDKHRATDPIIAHHIRNYRLERTRFSAVHLRRFNELAKLPDSAAMSVDQPLNVSNQNTVDQELERIEKTEEAEEMESGSNGLSASNEDEDVADLEARFSVAQLSSEPA